jgi:hypothetical protein
VEAVCLSYDNKIWLYDEFEHKLKKIDEDGKLLLLPAIFASFWRSIFFYIHLRPGWVSLFI